MNLISLLKDKWVQCTQEKVYDGQFHQLEKEWNTRNIKTNGDTIKETLHGFKHIIEVDYWKMYSGHEGANGWIIPEEFRKQYFYPHRELGDHAIVILMRGSYTNDKYIFERDEFGEKDATFVGTNNDEDALLIALKFK